MDTTSTDTTSTARNHVAARRRGAIGASTARRHPTAEQGGTEGAATASAPLADTTSPSVGAEATTPAAEPVPPGARAIAIAILSTLTPDAAACVLAALAGLASAIINAASTLRHARGDVATRAASTMLDAACDACEISDDGDAAVFAICGAWFYDAPRGIVASFWHDEIARGNVTSQARGVAAEVDALRAAPVNAPVTAPRVIRVEAPPFASSSASLTAAVGRAVFLADPSTEGYADASSGLAGLTSDLAFSTDAAGLVMGLARIAAHHASQAVEARTAQDAGAYLGFAAEALDAARGAARLTLDALDAAPPSTGTGDVKVRAA